MSFYPCLRSSIIGIISNSWLSIVIVCYKGKSLLHCIKKHINVISQ